MSGGYAIRAATDADLAALPALEQAAAQRFRDSPYPALADDPPGEARGDRARVWVAVDVGGAAVGFAEWTVVDTVAYLAEVDVDPAHAGHRLGAALIDAVAADAATFRLPRLVLTTFRDVAWNAPYYRRLGFVDVEPDAVGPELAAIIEHQVAAGLPRDRRCVLARAIAPA